MENMLVKLGTKSLVRPLSRSVLILRKYSPEILLGAGVVGTIASTVLACKATLKIDSVKAHHQKDIDRVEKLWNEMVESDFPQTDYTEEDYKKDLLILKVRRTVDIVKLYVPAGSLLTLSLACFLGSYGILQKRNIALVAAYNLVNETFNNYRQRVIEDVGKEKDNFYRHGYSQKEIEENVIGEDGKKKKEKKVVESHDGRMPSEYARFFDQFSPMWKKDNSQNLLFLRTQQNWANELLKTRGHVFLNEVYDMIGVPRSPAGAVVGWVQNKDNDDGFIDFGIYDHDRPTAHDFVNGYERAILLDFNVDGLVYDLI